MADVAARSWCGRWLLLIAGAVALSLGLGVAGPAAAQNIEDLFNAVVKIKTTVPGDARSAQTLGTERLGSGVVIDQNGLVLTIGYLILEAQGAEVIANDGHAFPAEVTAYDHETGFGLLRMLQPLKVKPLPLGSSAALKEKDTVVVASFGGSEMAAPALVVSKRTFAGSWEYLLDEAIFTSPPHPAWSGAALIDTQGKLVGIGSLIVGNAQGPATPLAGNMFVPIDRLKPILADLIADGTSSDPARPWLGVTTEEVGGRLFVSRVTPDGPAASAGIQRGDIILGVDNQPAANLVDLYRQIRARGNAGVGVPLTVLQGSDLKRITVESADRRRYLRLKSTY